MFKNDSNIPQALEKYQRILYTIAMLTESVSKPAFNEFDTVGLIVKIAINDYNQHMWLTDLKER